MIIFVKVKCKTSTITLSLGIQYMYINYILYAWPNLWRPLLVEAAVVVRFPLYTVQFYYIQVAASTILLMTSQI